MKREVTFKARRLDNKKWIEGYLFYSWEKCLILWGTINEIPNMIQVDPSTISQYTGYEDINNNKIFENDIVKFNNCGIYPIFFSDEYQCLGSCYYDDFDIMHRYVYDRLEVIGNIFENKELLEEE